ncbi:MAG TPA: DNA polymerase IV [Bacillota bacterium]|nr:DNA polymerase IV [Bacillota bacterium]
MSARTVLHVDANAFFAAVHQAEDPELRGKPVLVAGDPSRRHGIVLTASYEARAYGARTAMPLGQALRLCPHAIVLRPDHRRYVAYSTRLRDILYAVSPDVEAFSIDEAWCEVTGVLHLWGGDPLALARHIKGRSRDELNLTVSVGISDSKLLSKMASELQKPDGLTWLRREDVPARLWPRPVGELFGVGPRTAARLAELGVHTIGDLAAYPPEVLARRFGRMGIAMHEHAGGRDEAPVVPLTMDDTKSMGHETTLSRDVASPEEVDPVLLALAVQVASRLRAAGVRARTIHLKLRDAELKVHSRSRTLPEATDLDEAIYGAARAMFAERWQAGRAVRLVGISASGLEAGAQRSLLPEPGEDRRRLYRAVDQVRGRFGDRAILPARVLLDRADGLALFGDGGRGTSFDKEPLRRQGDDWRQQGEEPPVT